MRSNLILFVLVLECVSNNLLTNLRFSSTRRNASVSCNLCQSSDTFLPKSYARSARTSPLLLSFNFFSRFPRMAGTARAMTAAEVSLCVKYDSCLEAVCAAPPPATQVLILVNLAITGRYNLLQTVTPEKSIPWQRWLIFVPGQRSAQRRMSTEEFFKILKKSAEFQ